MLINQSFTTRYYLSAIFLFILSIGQVNAQTPVAKEIDAYVQSYVDERQFNGSILVAQKGEVILSKGYGMANFEWGIPVQPDTKFRIASITKQFTAMLIMQLKQAGQLKLDATISDYLPMYRKDIGEKVTIHQLLVHTSGIPSYTQVPGFMKEHSKNFTSVDQFIEEFCSGDLEFEPGSEYRYNNSAYFILGAIIEEITDKDFHEVLQEQIFDVIGMKNSGYDYSTKIIRNRASGYEIGMSSFENADYLDMRIPFSAGSMYSTVEDLHLWDRALYTEKLLSEENKKIMWTVDKNYYAYGWGVFDRKIKGLDNKVPMMSHSGGIHGFSTLITRILDEEYVIILLDNTGNEFHNDITAGIYKLMKGLPYTKAKKSIIKAMIQNTPDKDVDKALAFYKKAYKEDQDKYDFNESELNNLGYMILSEGQLEDAIKVFKLNVEMYPEAANPYDSLGEAYMMAGNKKLAILNYKKSLELDPKNQNAKNMIEEMESKK